MATRAEVNFLCAFAIEFLLTHHKNDPIVRDAVVRSIVKVGKQFSKEAIAKEALKELYTKITGKEVANSREFLKFIRTALGSDGTVKVTGISMDDASIAIGEADVQ
jgi:uridine phosphorylase